MSTEIRLAFAHPAERSEASSIDTSYDRISLRDHIVDVEIGAFQAERGTTQRVCFNIVVEVHPIENPVEDDVDRILSYDRVTEAIAYELAAERLNLLETLADRIAERILLEPQAVRVFVRIEKLDRGPGALGVEIVRARKATTRLTPIDETATKPHPIVVYLTNNALQSEHLSDWLDQLQAHKKPAILCVGLPIGHIATATHDMAQRRIDLLEIEQNAWRLADKDARCVVVATKTELDWAMKNGQISVWAPSKLILDAVEPPKADAHDGVALAHWLAINLEASQLNVVGQVETQAQDDLIMFQSIGKDLL